MRAGPRAVVLGMLAVMLAMAALAGPPGMARALPGADKGSVALNITLSQSLAKTNDTVGVTFSSGWTNTTYIIVTTPVPGPNNTTVNRTTITPQVRWVPSPGPVLITVKDSQGKDIVGTSGIHNLTSGLYSTSFLITPAFGLDTITFYAKDLYTNVSATPTSLQVDYSEAQRLADQKAATDHAIALINANDAAQESQRWFDFWVQSIIEAVVGVIAVLAVTYRVQKRAGINTWYDRLRHRQGFTSVVNPMRYAAHPVRTKTLNVPAEIAALDLLYKKKQAVEILQEMKVALDELEHDDHDPNWGLKRLENVIAQARTSQGLPAAPGVMRLGVLGTDNAGGQ